MDFSLTQLFNIAFPELQDYEGWSEEILPDQGQGVAAGEPSFGVVLASGLPSFVQDVAGRRFYLPQRTFGYGIAISFQDSSGTMHYWSLKKGATDWDRVTPVVPHERCWPTGEGVDPVLTWEGATTGDVDIGLRSPEPD